MLHEHDVDFVIVGGLAAYLHAAPIATHDLDIVYARAPENLERLQAALQRLHAFYRDPTGRRIEPTIAHLSSPHGAGHHLLQTRHGALDVLRSSGAFDFDRLLPRVVRMQIDGIEVQVAALEDIIEMKRLANRPKDQLALPTLRAVLEDQRSGRD